LLGPTNPMTYNTQQFYNNMLAIVAGVVAATIALVLVPPLSPEQSARRLLALTLRDLRRLAAGKRSPTTEDWENRIYARLSALPAASTPSQLSHLVAALSVGSEVIRLRQMAHRLGLERDSDAALDAIAAGDCAAAIGRLAAVDRKLAAPDVVGPDNSIRLRARGSICAISDALAQRAGFFAGGNAR
jgi:uncharacterized membrane protein YccC